MDINFRGTNYDVTGDITENAERKIRTVEKYLGNGANTAKAFVELGKALGAQHTGAVWRTEINLDCNGKVLRAEATAETLEDAIDIAVAELSREARKEKGRSKALVKKGNAVIKSFLRGFRS